MNKKGEEEKRKKKIQNTKTSSSQFVILITIPTKQNHHPQPIHLCFLSFTPPKQGRDNPVSLHLQPPSPATAPKTCCGFNWPKQTG